MLNLKGTIHLRHSIPIERVVICRPVKHPPLLQHLLLLCKAHTIASICPLCLGLDTRGSIPEQQIGSELQLTAGGLAAASAAQSAATGAAAGSLPEQQSGSELQLTAGPHVTAAASAAQAAATGAAAGSLPEQQSGRELHLTAGGLVTAAWA